MTELPVNEVFETFQGEAYFTGTPAIFIRLQGCDVGCPWCDTKHTWPVNAHDQRPLAMIMDKTQDSQTYALIAASELAAMVTNQFTSRHVVLTGGEPCRFNLVHLCEELALRQRQVQVETSGTEPVRVSESTWVTVSPKIGMPGGLGVRDDALERANEIKMPVGKPADVVQLEVLLAGIAKPPSFIWLQPLSRSVKATELCLAAARERGWRVSLQTHKFVGAR